KKSIAQWAKTQGKTIAPEKVDAVLKDRTGSAVCLTCGKNGKMKMPLKSLAWIQGSSSYSQAEVIEQTEETNSAEISETRTPEVPDVHTPEAQPHLNTQSDGTPTAYTEPAADSSPQVETPDQAASEPVDVLFSIDVIRQGNLRLGN
ncbi:hypothetical protein LN378_29525, partial [Enterobacter hormaechei subsp. steigerwaltii]|nr:hypothetical protein [Enterobacter hormaechei subsp. steigerwaltii]